MMSQIPEISILPSEDTCSHARKLWTRIKKRFELSHVWKFAPRELVATEFLSLIRFTLAPYRLEAALYDHLQEPSLIATTLKPPFFPDHSDEGIYLTEIKSLIECFFKEGGNSTRFHSYTPLERDKVFYDNFFIYLSRFKEPDIYNITDDGSLCLHILVDASYEKSRIEDLIRKAELHIFLRDETRPYDASSFYNVRQPQQQKLTGDYLLNEFLDRFENDLAVVIDAEIKDIWVLLWDESASPPTFRFHVPRQKIERLLNYYRTYLGSTVGKLREQVEKEGAGDFQRYLAQCRSDSHLFLSNAWDDSSPLTPSHLECIAEKFKNWPVDRGIAGSVVITGCSDVVCDFPDDYRVKAYSYRTPPERRKNENDDFYRVRLAERVFITIRPHLVEIPLLWGIAPTYSSSCVALLLVLFDYQDNTPVSPDDFAKKALSIREAIEPWYFLFEQHGQLVGWYRIILGRYQHAIRNIFKEFDRHVSDETRRAALRNKFNRLDLAHSSARDAPGLQTKSLTMKDFVDFLQYTAESIFGSDMRFQYSFEPFSDEYNNYTINLDTDLIQYSLYEFLEQSRSVLGNLYSDLNPKECEIYFRVIVKELEVLVEIAHLVTQGSADFIAEHCMSMGRMPLNTYSPDGQPESHFGLFFLGELLRACGGDFLPPLLVHDHGSWVTWKLAFKLL